MPHSFSQSLAEQLQPLLRFGHLALGNDYFGWGGLQPAAGFIRRKRD